MKTPEARSNCTASIIFAGLPPCLTVDSALRVRDNHFRRVTITDDSYGNGGATKMNAIYRQHIRVW